MSGPAIIDPFHRLLYVKLSEEISSRMASLVKGSAGTFEEYKFQIGYLSALDNVLDLCAELEKDKYGGKDDGEE